MATDTLYYGGAIDGTYKAVWQEAINEWMDANLDNHLARKTTELRQVDSTVEQYEISRIDFTGNDVIPTAKATPGKEVTIGKATELTPIWRWADYFMINEADLKKSPTLTSQYVEACMAKIYRGEDKVWYSGRTVNNIVGMKAASEANANGKIVAAGATGNDTNNGGAWLTDDGTRDIYQDMVNGLGKLDSKYQTPAKNIKVVCNSTTKMAFLQKDPYSDDSQPVYRSIAPLFDSNAEKMPIGDWLIVNDQIDDNYVFLVAKNRQAAELIQAQVPTIDDNYPRRPIGNLEVHVYQDLGIAFHDYTAFVEIAIN